MKVSTKGGGPYTLFQLFKGRVTPFPEFLIGIFVILFSIFLYQTEFFSFQLVSFNSVQVLVLQGYWVSTCILFHGT